MWSPLGGDLKLRAGLVSPSSRSRNGDVGLTPQSLRGHSPPAELEARPSHPVFVMPWNVGMCGDRFGSLIAPDVESAPSRHWLIGEGVHGMEGELCTCNAGSAEPLAIPRRKLTREKLSVAPKVPVKCSPPEQKCLSWVLGSGTGVVGSLDPPPGPASWMADVPRNVVRPKPVRWRHSGGPGKHPWWQGPRARALRDEGSGARVAGGGARC